MFLDGSQNSESGFGGKFCGIFRTHMKELLFFLFLYSLTRAYFCGSRKHELGGEVPFPSLEISENPSLDTSNSKEKAEAKWTWYNFLLTKILQSNVINTALKWEERDVMVATISLVQGYKTTLSVVELPVKETKRGENILWVQIYFSGTAKNRSSASSGSLEKVLENTTGTLIQKMQFFRGRKWV